MDDISQNELLEIINDAGKRGATDVHLSPDAPVMIRLNGELVMPDERILSAQVIESFFTQDPDGGRDLLLERGSTLFSYVTEEGGRYRVNLFETVKGYCAAMHYIPESVMSMTELMMPQAVCALSKKKSGLIIFSGTKGSGKTTCAASFADGINETEKRVIVTLGRVCEYVLAPKNSVIIQRETGDRPENMERAIRDASLQDADVIFADGSSDRLETEACIDAALNGQLVITTLEAAGVIESIKKIIKSADEYKREYIRDRLASALVCICSLCTVYGPQGERVMVNEIMTADRAIRNLIKEEKYNQILSLMQADKSGKMMTFGKHVSELVSKGVISGEIPENLIDIP
ncbi:MAG: Flp pilus assembly complex ATPase component TadA [Lachnospiraceae bacterium]|nr:Flp pilus assembly complex ATPase component TadA [Lachnospiraceae bacterium]